MLDGRVHLHLIQQFQLGARILAGPDLAPAFDHAYPSASAGKARCRNSATISGADHEHVVVLLQPLDRGSESGHGSLLGG